MSPANSPEQFLKTHASSIQVLNSAVTPFHDDDLRAVPTIEMTQILELGPSALDDSDHQRRRIEYCTNPSPKTKRSRSTRIRSVDRYVTSIDDLKQAVECVSTPFDGIVIWGGSRSAINLAWCLYALSQLDLPPVPQTIAWIAFSEPSNVRSAFVLEQSVTAEIVDIYRGIWREFTGGTIWSFEAALPSW